MNADPINIIMADSERRERELKRDLVKLDKELKMVAMFDELAALCEELVYDQVDPDFYHKDIVKRARELQK